MPLQRLGNQRFVDTLLPLFRHVVEEIRCSPNVRSLVTVETLDRRVEGVKPLDCLHEGIRIDRPHKIKVHRPHAHTQEDDHPHLHSLTPTQTDEQTGSQTSKYEGQVLQLKGKRILGEEMER